MLVLAIMWNLVAGYADIATVGQHAFVGVGAYAFYGFAAIADLDPFLAIPLASLVALVVAVPAMFLVFRLRTAYLSIGTWVIAEVLMLSAGKIEIFGGGSGISLPVEIMRAFGTTATARLSTIYWLAFASRSSPRRDLSLAALSHRPRPHGDARQRGERRLGRGRCRQFAHRLFSRHSAVSRSGRGYHAAETADFAHASFSITDWTVLVIFNVVIGGIGTSRDRSSAPSSSLSCGNTFPTSAPGSDPPRRRVDHDYSRRAPRNLGNDP